MSARSFPSFLSLTASKINKDRPLTEAEFPEVWGSFEGVARAAAARVSSAVVDDAVQETAMFFLTCVRAKAVAAAVPVIRTLLRRTARNMALSERRRLRIARHTAIDDEDEAPLVANGSSPETLADARSLARRIVEVGPKCMNPKRWAVVELYLRGELPQEIQAATGMNDNTVRGDLMRGRAALCTALGIKAKAA